MCSISMVYSEEDKKSTGDISVVGESSMQMHNDLKHQERDEKDKLVVENTKDCDVQDSDDVCDNSADSDSDGNTGRIKDQIGLIINRIKDKGGVQDISWAPSPVIMSPHFININGRMVFKE